MIFSFLVYPGRINEIPGVHYENEFHLLPSHSLHMPSNHGTCSSQRDSTPDPHIICPSILCEKPEYAVCDGSKVVDVCGHFYHLFLQLRLLCLILFPSPHHYPV